MRNFIILLLITLFGCSRIQGKIEFRDRGCDETIPDSKMVYLVNKSAFKSYRFTVRKTEITNDTIRSYKVDFHILEPGSEEFLKCDKWLVPKKNLPKEDRIKNYFAKISMYFPDGSQAQFDTIAYKEIYAMRGRPVTDSFYSNEIGYYYFFDTVINDQHELYLKYNKMDKSNLNRWDKHEVEYTVTGQKEFIWPKK